MNKSKFPTILGILFLVVGVAVGAFLITQEQVFRLGASPEASPQDIQITNITGRSFTVSWTTSKDSVSQFKWGTPGDLKNTAFPSQTRISTVHSISATGALPATDYEFSIQKETSFVTTAPTLPAPTTTLVISGSIIDQAGSPANSAVVTITKDVSFWIENS